MGRSSHSFHSPKHPKGWSLFLSKRSVTWGRHHASGQSQPTILRADPDIIRLALHHTADASLFDPFEGEQAGPFLTRLDHPKFPRSRCVLQAGKTLVIRTHPPKCRQLANIRGATSAATFGHIFNVRSLILTCSYLFIFVPACHLSSIF